MHEDHAVFQFESIWILRVMLFLRLEPLNADSLRGVFLASVLLQVLMDRLIICLKMHKAILFLNHKCLHKYGNVIGDIPRNNSGLRFSRGGGCIWPERFSWHSLRSGISCHHISHKHATILILAQEHHIILISVCHFARGCSVRGILKGV